MPRYFIEFSYEGLNYHGLQKQPNSETIQECVELNMSKFLGSSIDLTLAGRTDTGVHARQMFAHFDHNVYARRLPRSFHRHLPGVYPYLPWDVQVVRRNMHQKRARNKTFSDPVTSYESLTSP